jgi:iron complex outermembrane receptor protein
VDIPEFGIFDNMHADESGQNITGKVTLNYQLDPNNFLYAFVASGAKPGGLNTPLEFLGGFIPAPFRQEYVTDYEIGWKSTLFENHLHLQLGAYDNSFQHFQVILPIPGVPEETSEANVPGRTKLYGLEASAQAVFGDLSFFTGLGLEHSELPTFWSENPNLVVDGLCNPATGPTTSPASPYCVNLKGHPQTYAPDFTFNFGAYYNFHINGDDKLTPGLTYSHISSQWATRYDNRAEGDYLTPRDLLGASLAWMHGTYVVTAYCCNLRRPLRRRGGLAAPHRRRPAPVRGQRHQDLLRAPCLAAGRRLFCDQMCPNSPRGLCWRRRGVGGAGYGHL